MITLHVRSGVLIVSRDAVSLDDVGARVAAGVQGSALAGEVARLDNARARELFPLLAHDLEDLYIRGGARVDVRTLPGPLFVPSAGIAETSWLASHD